MIKHIQTPLCFHLSWEIVFFKVNERGKGKRYRDTKRLEKSMKREEREEERRKGKIERRETSQHREEREERGRGERIS